MQQLGGRTDTHFGAALAGWRWPVTWGEITLHLTYEAQVNRYRDTKKYPEWITLDAPWTPSPEAPPTEEELIAARALLRRNSAFADDS